MPRGADTAVSIVERADLPLLSVLGRELAQVFADLHTANGVQLRLGSTLTEITADGDLVTGVQLGDGTFIAADAVVIGIGVAPDVALAEAAGLKLDNGVLVDALLRTSDPDVYTVGDIANQDHPTLGSRVRVEHWATALKQPAAAAAAMLGSTGSDAIYTDLPYFFSDQYDLGMEYNGPCPEGLLRSCSGPRRPRGPRIRGLLAGRCEPHQGGDERQHLGRHRADQAP